MFQSTLPHGERPIEPLAERAEVCFNPRSHMGSDKARVILIYSTGCFNPRSHMGSDFLGGISIELQQRFNPRSHMGSDFAVVSSRCSAVVSIHAPTWGAT